MNILSAAYKYCMFQNGDKVLVAVSGGPDSVAMLHALHSSSDDLGITLHIAHLNHGIRGKQAEQDAEFVRNLAESYSIPVSIGNADVPALMKELGVGVEEAARISRYNFLQDTARTLSANKIAVGHTADDRAESVLLNVIRGTGIDGLGSIRPVRGNVVRPLINATRRDVEDYIRFHNLQFRIDESNLSKQFTRNRVRHELIPILEENYNPNIRNALIKIANIAADQSELMQILAESVHAGLLYKDAVDIGLLLDIPKALQYQIVRSMIEKVKGNLLNIEYDQIHNIICSLESGVDFTISLPPGNVYASGKGNLFRVWTSEANPQIKPFEYCIKVPGTTEIPEIELTINAELIKSVKDLRTPSHIALIDADAIKGELKVRNIMPGDRIVPFGMKGSKKLQDVFVDKKITKNDRAKAAIVTDDEKILWVVGIVHSELARVSNNTRRIVKLEASNK